MSTSVHPNIQLLNYIFLFPLDPKLQQESQYRRIDFNKESKCWELFTENGITVVAAALKHRIPSYGFIIKEKDKPGRLNAEKLSATGIQPGGVYGKLKSGQKVTLETGEVLDPADYLGPAERGRSLAICGDTCDSQELVTAAQHLDLLGKFCML